MLTTRNSDLDILARGKSLGSDPLPKSIKNPKLRFGPLVSQQAPEKIGSDESPRHVAFGFEGSVDELKKCGNAPKNHKKYTGPLSISTSSNLIQDAPVTILYTMPSHIISEGHMVYLRFRGYSRTIGRRTLAISKTLYNMLVTMKFFEI
ncbi:uncharacterized protein EAE98_001563 [Botrytis deweyae]|uniref:Uncharacterized protein n=1 Tax=Botrytis deweyae TaxID=2478750 RepID=A0ABQ7IY89_9HELO|nr:uncharacterized protein EAE98_001563 [Botrytis deweyae]KAF7937249.1 hypothetical protein EAE98_001563 [Botrytis deweyae]